MEKIRLAIVALCVFTCACTSEKEQEKREAVNNAAEKFANLYFNYQLNEVMPLTTADSHKWLRFAASNITQADIDMLRTMESADCSVKGITYSSDSTAVVKVEVRNVLLPDTLGAKPHITPKALFRLALVNRSKKWLVKMEGPLRSERQSRD